MIKQGQNAVEPMRSKEDIKNMKEYLLHQSYRDYFPFVFGMNSGLRISDILPLRDVRNVDHISDDMIDDVLNDFSL